METLKLIKRELTGKKLKELRKNDIVPGVLYNSKTESSNIQISKTEAIWLYRNTTSTTILDGELDGKKVKFIVKEFDLDPIKGDIVHISLFEIDTTAPMVFTIPFNIIGISPAVKNNLGILVNVLDSIEVRCKVEDLKPSIDIDISELTHVGQTINVGDLNLPEGMTLINEDIKGAAIVSITEAQKVETFETAAVTEEGAETAEEITGEATEEKTE